MKNSNITSGSEHSSIQAEEKIENKLLPYPKLCRKDSIINYVGQ